MSSGWRTTGISLLLVVIVLVGVACSLSWLVIFNSEIAPFWSVLLGMLVVVVFLIAHIHLNTANWLMQSPLVKKMVYATVVHTYGLARDEDGKIVPHPETQARLRIAAEMYQAKETVFIVLPHGWFWIDGILYDATIYEKDCLKKQGVPDNVIIFAKPPDEETTGGTRGEIERALAICQREGTREVAFVSNRLHLLRISWLIWYYQRKMKATINASLVESPCRLSWLWKVAEILATIPVCFFDRGANGWLFKKLQSFALHRTTGG